MHDLAMQDGGAGPASASILPVRSGRHTLAASRSSDLIGRVGRSSEPALQASPQGRRAGDRRQWSAEVTRAFSASRAATSGLRCDDATPLLAARAAFFEHAGLGTDGGYDARWVRIEAKPFPMFFPNTHRRVAAAKLHDLHHVATEYATDWPGEAEIAAWEIGGGCGPYGWAWSFVAWSVITVAYHAAGIAVGLAAAWMAWLSLR